MTRAPDLAGRDIDQYLESHAKKDLLRFITCGSVDDGKSLCRLLETLGFVEATQVPVGSTRIPNPGPLNLRERESESVYVEAIKPFRA